MMRARALRKMLYRRGHTQPRETNARREHHLWRRWLYGPGTAHNWSAPRFWHWAAWMIEQQAPE